MLLYPAAISVVAVLADDVLLGVADFDLFILSVVDKSSTLSIFGLLPEVSKA